jgi:ABC-type Fe3+ transport system permease subunit
MNLFEAIGFRVIAILLLALTLSLCFKKWKRTKDIGFLILFFFFVFVPLLFFGVDAFCDKISRDVYHHGEVRMFFLTLSNRERNDAVNILTFLQAVLWLKIVLTELSNLFLVIIISRLTVVVFKKKPNNEIPHKA